MRLAKKKQNLCDVKQRQNTSFSCLKMILHRLSIQGAGNCTHGEDVISEHGPECDKR